MDAVSSALASLVGGRSLSTSESRSALASILDGESSEVLAAAFLAALRIRGETAADLEAAVCAVRERMIPWDSGLDSDSLVDTCGTGGDGAGTVNISTGAAMVVAACGVPVVKHGNRSATGLSGSSDVLSVLGIATNLDASASRRCLAELGVTFLFAPAFHPGLARIAGMRRHLPFRTIFNLVGPLCNPGSPSCQLVGVPHESQASLMADVLSKQTHIRRAAVVTGCDGLDEVTLDGPTQVWAIDEGRLSRQVWNPEDFGLDRQSASGIKARDSIESADKLTRALSGEHGSVRHYILANSAAALWVARQWPLREGTARAAAAIDSGAVGSLMERWRRLKSDENVG